MGFALRFFLALFLGIFLYMIVFLCNLLFLKPQRIRTLLEKQGIRGPAPSFFYGNIPQMKAITAEAKRVRTGDQTVSHDHPTTLFPYYDRWISDYGPTFVYSMGTMVLLYISSPNLVKEMSLCKSLAFGKPSYLQKDMGSLFGHGIITANGEAWSRQRKVIAPELFMDKVKAMVDLMVDSAIELLELWESRIESEGGVGNIRIDEDLRSFSADVISKACFGSSYSKGKAIFQRLRDLQQVMSEQNLVVGIPGSRFIPSKNNMKIWRLEREIQSLILKVVNERQEDPVAATEQDLLKAILESAASSGDFGTDPTNSFVVDNLKNIYFAGHETTAISATWTLLLLSLNPEWQTRVRDEVVRVCDGRMPDVEMLRKMKTLTMVVQESLRLYPPAGFVVREALEEMKFADIRIPVGTMVRIPIAALQQDPKFWGPDAHTFNPERFTRGINGACKLPHVYIPFGNGIRTCVGQNFATMELKVVLSLILSRFTFSVSLDYHHAPKFGLVLEPSCGVNLLMKNV